MTTTLSAHEHARIMYREMLISLRKFNEAEAEYEALLVQERKSVPSSRPGDDFPTMTAVSRADARATDRGIIGRITYHRERVVMHALAYQVSVNYGQTFEQRHGS